MFVWQQYGRTQQWTPKIVQMLLVAGNLFKLQIVLDGGPDAY